MFWYILEWANKGIIGRGVLIDFYSYALEEGIAYDPWSYHKISVPSVERIAQRSGIIFEPGDILFLRTGANSTSFSIFYFKFLCCWFFDLLVGHKISPD